ncbi:hypothetical protein [Streptomyces sp. BA2]|uniref:hypothetical protein n=1 Tax=Streptomyces sp. BA2 TaxID=436595 RepID=UPI0013244974|nr:hypothetical protein [Streptomyces sp. BA2]MWA13959.1 hypothetical protein [Streptomyces sp. BA2]
MPAPKDPVTEPQRSPLPSPGSPTAWDEPPTRRAWRWHTVRTVLALAGWIAVWFALYGIMRNIFTLASVVLVPYSVYAAYRLLVLLAATLPDTLRIRRTLRGHPWRLVEGAEHGFTAHPAAAKDHPWIAVPDPETPDDPDARLPLLLLVHPGTRWWTRRMRSRATAEQRAEIRVLWCCGDPRADVVIAASARSGAGKAPRRLLHLQQRNALVAGRRHRGPGDSDPEILDSSRAALSHLPTARTMRSRMRRRVLLLVLLWPALLATQIVIVAHGDDDRIGLFMVIVLAQLAGLPMHIFVLVSTRRMTRLLAGHSWRPVDCTVRMRGKTQLITVEGRELTPNPWRTHVDEQATRLWIAGDLSSRCMASAPGGARPVSLAPAR